MKKVMTGLLKKGFKKKIQNKKEVDFFITFVLNLFFVKKDLYFLIILV